MNAAVAEFQRQMIIDAATRCAKAAPPLSETQKRELRILLSNPGGPLDGPTWLYRHYDASGELLYIGISDHPETRERNHRKHSPWGGDIARVELSGPHTRTEALAAEKLAIQTELPLHNRQHSLRGDS